jgi:hypothetical protein
MRKNFLGDPTTLRVPANQAPLLASEMNCETIIRKPDGEGIAILHYREWNSPSWVPSRADYGISANDLSLLESGIRTRGRFFTDQYVVSPDGAFLLLEEMEFDGTQDSVDQHSSRLILIETRNAIEADVGRIDDGHCIPRRIDEDGIIYSKMRRTWRGVFHDFERDISSLTWKPMGILSCWYARFPRDAGVQDA